MAHGKITQLQGQISLMEAGKQSIEELNKNSADKDIAMANLNEKYNKLTNEFELIDRERNKACEELQVSWIVYLSGTTFLRLQYSCFLYALRASIKRLWTVLNS